MAASPVDCWAGAPGPLRLAIGRLARKYPLHAHLLTGWEVEVSDATPTMAVTLRDGQLWLLVNSEFVAGCSLPELAGVLLHEANHLLFGHLLLEPARYPSQAALTVAQEVTVNEWVPEPLPGEPITLSLFPFLPPDEDVDRRYHRLAAELPDGVSIATTDDHAHWGAAAPSPLDRLAVQAGMRAAVVQVDPDAWAALPCPIRDAALRTARGAVAGSTVEPVHEPGRGSAIDWRIALRRFISQSVRSVPSLHRPSRRFPDLVGVVPGKKWEPLRRRVLAVVDTSASISRTEIRAIGTELSALGTENEVILVECDCMIQAVYPLAGPLTKVRGRGGTDLRPPLDPGFLGRHRADLVVYFTDGFGPAPDRPPPVPVLWCLTPRGQRPAHWGAVARLWVPEAPDRAPGEAPSRRPGGWASPAGPQ